MEKLIETINVTKEFPVKKDWFGRTIEKLVALRDVSVYVKEGETLGVIGESGCGKSTLAKTILDLEKPTKGEIRYLGKNIRFLKGKEYRNYRLNVQAVFQNPQGSLNPRMKGWEIVTEGLKINYAYIKKELKEKARELIELVNLPLNALESYPHQLSGGQKQRLAIARAVALKPKLIVADEPTSALDVSVQAQIVNLFLDLQEKFGMSYFFISHSLPTVEAVSDRVIVMYKGYVVEEGRTEDVISSPLHPYTKLLVESTPVPQIGLKKKRVISTDDEKVPESGCPFYFRCSYRKKECLSFDMKPIVVENGRKVACLLFS
ncbi:peptide/nickel transport system ATP-binding protein/oligopeptide transport system ATP-binding protein [Desulfurobacterium pacificum]|uniref:Peptide/nickel transport system ATP-binding protein/oligopeptide transport system ATP-binding protein n=1 Tax=Desulfurobacterium pacificum TaxID=240166 RepID=A0ABY1NFV7_9BACT|nr:oligopeptide/dipeptide ABC transporter ATP-binding protein [Desulfurobacterium pacificum]SMP08290.1 peptide/nickel transport system ATP-binding protein/oligopeptide transport system ATP-binding protein [Desulfurobacterium pacificum]